MKALRYENGRLAVTEIPAPGEDAGREAVVRVVLAGICNTDLEIARGYAGFQGTLGHEFVGVVERASAAAEKLIGKRVMGEINAGCGHCELCAAGDPRHCPQRSVLGIVGRNGAFAELLRLPIANLLPVPDEIADHQAVFTEPLAAACGIIESVTITNETRVAVIGDGKLGLLCAQAVIAQTGANVVLIGKYPHKLRIARERGSEILMLNEAHKLKRTCDVVVEASGSAGGFALALDILRPRGTLVLKSTFHGDTTIDAARIVVDEIRVTGSRCGRFAPALDLLRRNAVDVESLISEEHPLTGGVKAMERAAAQGILKVLLKP